MDDLVHFTLKSRELPVFYTYFALGVLRAIKSRVVSPDVGIWTLAHPNVAQFIQSNANAPQELIEILQTCDELSFGETFFEGSVDGLMARLEALLKTYPEHNVFPSFHWLSGRTPDN